jgi:hypothetical protein
MDQDRAVTIVKLLLEADADPNVAYEGASKHPDVETPLDIAKWRKYGSFGLIPLRDNENQMTHFLRQYGGKEAKEFRGVAEKVADTLRGWLGSGWLSNLSWIMNIVIAAIFLFVVGYVVAPLISSLFDSFASAIVVIVMMALIWSALSELDSY